jgi:hypothetical protein
MKSWACYTRRNVWTRGIVSVVASISLACYILTNVRTRDIVSVSESVSSAYYITRFGRTRDLVSVDASINSACYITRNVRIRDLFNMEGDQKCTVRIILAVQLLRNLLLIRQKRSMEDNIKTNEERLSTLQIVGKYGPKESKVYLNRKLDISVKSIQARLCENCHQASQSNWNSLGYKIKYWIFKNFATRQ